MQPVWAVAAMMPRLRIRAREIRPSLTEVRLSVDWSYEAAPNALICTENF
jgi:hypothetical protein